MRVTDLRIFKMPSTLLDRGWLLFLIFIFGTQCRRGGGGLVEGYILYSRLMMTYGPRQLSQELFAMFHLNKQATNDKHVAFIIWSGQITKTYRIGRSYRIKLLV